MYLFCTVFQIWILYILPSKKSKSHTHAKQFLSYHYWTWPLHNNLVHHAMQSAVFSLAEKDCEWWGHDASGTCSRPQTLHSFSTLQAGRKILPQTDPILPRAHHFSTCFCHLFQGDDSTGKKMYTSKGWSWFPLPLIGFWSPSVVCWDLVINRAVLAPKRRVYTYWLFFSESSFLGNKWLSTSEELLLPMLSVHTVCVLRYSHI